MEAMQETVKYRRKQDAADGHENEPAEQGIAGGKQLSRLGVQFVHRPHAAQDHGRVEEGVDPGQAFGDVITEDPHRQRCSHDQKRQANALCNASKKKAQRRYRLLFVFEHIAPFSDADSGYVTRSGGSSSKAACSRKARIWSCQ